MMKSMLLLAFSQVVAAIHGRYCAEQASVPGFTTYVQLDFMESGSAYKGLLAFRVDGGMHWASCHGTEYEVGEGGILTLAPSECMTRLAEEKTGGKLPVFTYDQDRDSVSMTTTTNYALLGTFTLDFSEDICNHMIEENELHRLRGHDEL